VLRIGKVFRIWCTSGRNPFVRESNKLDNSSNTRASRSVLNYERSSIFAMKRFEAQEYRRAFCKAGTGRMKNRYH